MLADQDQLFVEFGNQVIDGEFCANELGSCQYSTVNNFLSFVKNEKPTNVSLVEFCRVIGIELKFDEIADVAVVKQQLQEEQRKELADAKSVGENWLIEYATDHLTLLKDAKTYADLFIYCRNSSMDLWGAARLLGKKVFIGLSIQCEAKPTTYGPVMNQLVQSEGLTTGVICALFLDRKLINNTAAFADFDT